MRGHHTSAQNCDDETAFEERCNIGDVGVQGELSLSGVCPYEGFIKFWLRIPPGFSTLNSGFLETTTSAMMKIWIDRVI